MGVNERLASLREFLYVEPCADAWLRLCVALDAWPQELDPKVGVNYADHHLEGWPNRLRRAPRRWWTSTLEASQTKLRVARHLDLSEEPAPAASLRRLMASRWARRVTDLSLRRTGADVQSLRTMAESSFAAQLVRLDLSNNGLSRREMEVLASSGVEFASISWLDLHLNRLGDDGLRALCHARWLERVEELSLRNNELRAHGMEALGTVSPASLRSLDLSFNPVGSAGLRQLATWSGLAELSQLGLWGCEIGIDGVEALVAEGAISKLRSLDLGSNGLGPGVVDALRSSATKLSELNLALNHLGDDGAQCLASWPEAATLEVLKLDHNGIGDAGHRALLASPYLNNDIKSALRRAHT